MLSAALALTLLAAAPATPVADPAAVVAAERAFAADGAVMGVRDSFVKHSLPSAILLSDKPRTSAELFGARPPGKPAGEPTLVWWPLWAGIARSGDLGFTSGPSERGGVRGNHYFTVWQKQPDGAWKWIYDGGGVGSGKNEAPKDSPVTYLPLATGTAGSPEQAMLDIRGAEEEFAEAARHDQRAAHLELLADDGRVYVGDLPPAKSKAEFSAVLAALPRTLAMGEPLGGSASKAGDLVWTYGPVGWSEGAAAKRPLRPRLAGSQQRLEPRLLDDPPGTRSAPGSRSRLRSPPDARALPAVASVTPGIRRRPAGCSGYGARLQPGLLAQREAVAPRAVGRQGGEHRQGLTRR